jgi:protocatechuate 3,4-dioxygenase beta subunit
VTDSAGVVSTGEQTPKPAPASSPDDITRAVLASFAGTPDERLRDLLRSLVKHLHAFVHETRLTEEEWASGIRILTETGAITDELRQEFILWSDSLGISMLVDAHAHPKPPGATESTVLGPFHVAGAPERAYGENMIGEPAGTPAWVHGRVADIEGRPIADAELDVWQNGDNGLYAVQDVEAAEDHLRGRFRTRDDGSYAFIGVRPVPYTIPSDGPVGRMLEASGRHPWRPAHIHLIVSAPGYQTLTTHIFDESSTYLESDAVFAVKPGLLRSFVTRAPDDPARPPGIEGEWCSVENDIVLASV